jgi:DNA (cytosine-5)-methyltransferase 1
VTVGSLFAGIGGFDLAAERAGFEVRWQVEMDPFCRRVLEKHWPHVRRYEDVRTVGSELERVDIICGGFPCQPVSSASRGRRLGTADHRWLWPEDCRIVALKRPTWFLGENVTHLDGPPLEQVVSDLESLGYEVAPPFEVPACAFGFDHWRPRLWILGHADRDGQSGLSIDAEVARLPRDHADAGIAGGAHGVSGRLDRRRMAALGNAIVPQIAEWIFERIKEADAVTA